MILSGAVADSTRDSISVSTIRTARNAVTGPCVTQYGPLAAGDRSMASVPMMASTANPCPNWRALMPRVCHRGLQTASLERRQGVTKVCSERCAEQRWSTPEKCSTWNICTG